MASFWRISLPSTFKLLMLVDYDLLFKNWFTICHVAFILPSSLVIFSVKYCFLSCLFRFLISDISVCHH